MSKEDAIEAFAGAEEFMVCLVNAGPNPIKNLVVMQGSYASDEESMVVQGERIREVGALRPGTAVVLETVSFDDLDFVNWYWIDLWLSDQERVPIAFQINKASSLTEDIITHVPVLNQAAYNFQFEQRDETQVIPTGDTAKSRDHAQQLASKTLSDTLATVLTWPPFSHVIVEVITSDNYYVQFATNEDGSLHGEAVSNTCLEGDEQLDERATARLLELGWQPPEVTVKPADEDYAGLVNYYLEWAAPVPVAEVAKLATRTLFEVYGVKDSWELQYEMWSHEEEAGEENEGS